MNKNDRYNEWMIIKPYDKEPQIKNNNNRKI